MLVVTNAAVGTAQLVYLLWPREFAGPGPGWLVLTVLSGAVLSAWTATWAWRSERWGVASPALVLSLAMPWFYLVIIAAPMILGLATVAGVRAFRGRRRVVAERPPTRRIPVAELGPVFVGILAGLALTLVRAVNGESYDRAILPSIAFGVVIATPGLLALMAGWRRPSLYLASGLIFLPAGFLSLAGVTLPLFLIGAMAFVAYGRHADDEVPLVWAPLTAGILFVLTVASYSVMLFRGGDDPRCSSTATSISCTSDVITNAEALAALGSTLLTLAVAWLLSMPRGSETPGRAHPRRLRMKSRLLSGLSCSLAGLASAYLALVPTYSGVSSMSSSNGDTLIERSSATLLETNPGALPLLIFPLALTAATVLAPSRAPKMARRIRATAGFLLLAFVLFGAFSIGFLYLPAAGVMMLAAGAVEDVKTHDRRVGTDG